MFTKITGSFAALALAAAVTASALAGDGGSEEKVKLEVQPGKLEGGKQTVALHLTVDRDWYIYANPVGNEDFEINATKVALVTKGAKLKVDYPAGMDKTLGKAAFKIYTGKVTIQATLERGADPVELSVRVNSCNKNLCLPPGTLKVTVK